MTYFDLHRDINKFSQPCTPPTMSQLILTPDILLIQPWSAGVSKFQHGISMVLNLNDALKPLKTCLRYEISRPDMTYILFDMMLWHQLLVVLWVPYSCLHRSLVWILSGCQYSPRLDVTAQGIPEPSSQWGNTLGFGYQSREHYCWNWGLEVDCWCVAHSNSCLSRSSVALCSNSTWTDCC